MSKYLIFGATGSIGSSLSEQLYKSKKEIHIIGKDEEEIKKLSSNLRDLILNQFLDQHSKEMCKKQ